MSLIPTPMSPRLEMTQFDGGRMGLPPPFASAFSLADFIALAFKYKVRIIAAFVLPVAVAVALIFSLPPVYRAQTSLVVGTGPEYLARGDGNATATAPASTKQEFINTEIELLNSRPVLEETISRVGVENLYPGISKKAPATETATEAAAKRFTAALSVEPVKMSNLIRVTFDHNDLQSASRILDEFINCYQELHSKVFSSRRAAGYEETIARDVGELEKLEHQRATIKASAGIFDIGEQRTALLQQRAEAQRHLQETVDSGENLRRRLDYLAGIRPQLSNNVQSIQTDVSAETVHANEMLVELQQREAALRTTFAPNSPMITRVHQQIEALQHTLKNMNESTTRVSTAPSPITTDIDQQMIKAHAEMAPLQAQKQRYEALISGLSNELERNERADMLLRILNSRIDAQNDNLKEMRRLYDQARAQDAMDLAKVTSVVQTAHAITPDTPVAPKKLVLLAGGVIAGLIGAAGVLIFAAITNRTFFSEATVERLTGLPVLGSVELRISDQRGVAR